MQPAQLSLLPHQYPAPPPIVLDHLPAPEIAEAIRTIYSATHNCAEGAGAAALAALIKERERLQGRRAAVILSGQNIDRPWMQAVLAGDTPRVS